MCTALVVDDEPMVLRAMSMMMEIWGFEVLPASSGAEALKHAWEAEPDVILADYRLRGGETGVDVVRSVGQHLGKELPALIVTGDTAPERVREILSSGLTLLHKPLHTKDLQESLIQILPEKCHPHLRF